MCSGRGFDPLSEGVYYPVWIRGFREEVVHIIHHVLLCMFMLRTDTIIAAALLAVDQSSL